MYLSKFQLFNYKSFFDSGLLEFSPGINIIVGQNNSGKTALLEALTLNFDNVPHRSNKTLPNPSSKIERESRGGISLHLDKGDLRTLLNEIPHPIGVPTPPIQNDNKSSWQEPEDPRNADYDLAHEVYIAVKEFNALLDNSDSVELILPLSISSNLLENGILTKRLNFGLYLPIKEGKSNQYSFTEIQAGKDKGFTPDPDFMYESEDDVPDYPPTHYWSCYQGGVEETITYKIFNLFRNRIYRFHAERLNVHSCPLGESSELKPDASNLPEVLYVLQNLNPPRFNRFNRYLSIVFPQIKEVSVRPDNSTLEIMVWSIEAAKNEREDLAFPLSACGTGISQVLAILYVVLTSSDPRTIIIDEPQSFLHPGAAKKLVEILREPKFTKHQYFIATHSPMIIAAANYPNVVKLKYENCETTAQIIESEKTKEQRYLVNDLGISFSDAFGSDNVLWVEGQTEELCFPEILKMNGRHLGGTQILRVNAASDFGKDKIKHAELLLGIYRRIGGEGSLFPPMIGLVLDREKLTDEQIKSLREKSRCQDEEGRTRYMAKFLKRRMYENYLLHSEAIAGILNEIFNDPDELRRKCLTSTEIQEWLDEKKRGGWIEKDKKGKDTYQNGISESDWENKVDGATLLEDLFREFSADEYGATLVPFDKTKHNPKLTKWLLNNKPECFSELSNLLKKVLDGEETG